MISKPKWDHVFETKIISWFWNQNEIMILKPKWEHDFEIKIRSCFQMWMTSRLVQWSASSHLEELGKKQKLWNMTQVIKETDQMSQQHNAFAGCPEPTTRLEALTTCSSGPAHRCYLLFLPFSPFFLLFLPHMLKWASPQVLEPSNLCWGKIRNSNKKPEIVRTNQF